MALGNQGPLGASGGEGARSCASHSRGQSGACTPGSQPGLAGGGSRPRRPADALSKRPPTDPLHTKPPGAARSVAEEPQSPGTPSALCWDRGSEETSRFGGCILFGANAVAPESGRSQARPCCLPRLTVRKWDGSWL